MVYFFVVLAHSLSNINYESKKKTGMRCDLVIVKLDSVKSMGYVKNVMGWVNYCQTILALNGS